ncbi:hypothetical protein LXL04_023879 [Taraxacum kok-saghyz]
MLRRDPEVDDGGAGQPAQAGVARSRRWLLSGRRWAMGDGCSESEMAAQESEKAALPAQLCERVIGSYPHPSYATLPTPIHTDISTHHGTMTYISHNFYPHSQLPAQVPLKPNLHLQTHIHNNTLPYSDPFPSVHIHAPTPTESIPIASFVITGT